MHRNLQGLMDNVACNRGALATVGRELASLDDADISAPLPERVAQLLNQLGQPGPESGPTRNTDQMSDAVKQNDRTIQTGGWRSGGRNRRRLGRPTTILLSFVTYLVLFYLVIFKSGVARSVLHSFLAFPARRHSNAWMLRAAARAGAIRAVAQYWTLQSPLPSPAQQTTPMRRHMKE